MVWAMTNRDPQHRSRVSELLQGAFLDVASFDIAVPAVPAVPIVPTIESQVIEGLPSRLIGRMQMVPTNIEVHSSLKSATTAEGIVSRGFEAIAPCITNALVVIAPANCSMSVLSMVLKQYIRAVEA